jgi:hypothetical protein
MTETTRAEVRARELAGRLEQAGFTVTVTLEHTEPVPGRRGGVVIPGRVWVSVSARGPQSWDNGYSFTFVSDLPATGHRAATRFAGGHQYRHLRGRRRQPSAKLTLKELRSWSASSWSTPATAPGPRSSRSAAMRRTRSRCGATVMRSPAAPRWRRESR